MWDKRGDRFVRGMKNVSGGFKLGSSKLNFAKDLLDNSHSVGPVGNLNNILHIMKKK
jgi:hypothetical protein